MLNNRGESGHPFIAWDLRGRALSFNVKCDASCRFWGVEPLYEIEEVPIYF